MPGGYVRRTGFWQRPLSVGSCHRQDWLSHSNREAKAMHARQPVRTSCHEPREAVHRGGCNAQRRAAPFWPVTNGSECRPQPPAAAGACGMRALPCKYVHFGAEPRPRAYTPGAMVARAWSDLMCLETQGTRGGRQKLVLDGCGRGLEPRSSGQCLFKRGSALEAAFAAGCGAARTR